MINLDKLPRQYVLKRFNNNYFNEFSKPRLSLRNPLNRSYFHRY